MMKKFSFSIFSFLLIFAVMSCEKDRTFVEFADLEKGAIARQLSRSGAFFLTDIANSKYDISVEFYDENQGKNVTEYNWTVQYIDRTNGGADNAGPVNLLSIPASQFTTNPDSGLPMVSFSITLQQTLDAFGFTKDDVTVGSTFRFSATIVLNDGRTFSGANTEGNLISSAAFNALFSFDANLICLSDIAGIYTVETTYAQHDFLPDFPSNTLTGVEVRKVGEGQYEVDDFSGGLYSVGAPYNINYGTTGLLVTFNDVCGDIRFTGATDPWQNLLQNPAQPSFVDPATGVITISVVGDVYGETWTSIYTPE